MITATIASLSSALANAIGAVLQRRVVSKAPKGRLFSFKFLIYVTKQQKWLLGLLISVVGFILQALALISGQLSLVEPLLMTELLFLLLILRRRYNEPIGPREWLGAAGITLGLGFLLAFANPSKGSVPTNGTVWIITALVIMAVVLVAGVLTKLIHHKGLAAAIMGVAGGCVFALVAALTKLAISQVQHGIGPFLASWTPWALLVGGIASLVVTQYVFRAGPLATSQPAMMIADPGASIAIGVILFNEQLRHTMPAVIGMGISGAVLITGVILLGSSPVVVNQRSLSV
jgi:drug/metabolite transporter (DMT)-like permease